MKNNDQTKVKFEEGSGNVFADLSFDDADELFARATLGFQVYKLLNDKKLKQKEIAVFLGIEQPEVSHLMNGHFGLPPISWSSDNVNHRFVGSVVGGSDFSSSVGTYLGHVAENSAGV